MTVTSPATAPTSTPPERQSAWGSLLRTRELGIVLALIVLVGYTAINHHRFLSGQSIRDILLNTAIIAVMAAGQAVVIITRNIDLSVGSVLGLSAFTVATTVSAHRGLPMIVAILIGLAVGAACGLVNGVLVRYGRVPALVVTLGTLYIYQGITYSWAGGQQVNADELPAHFLNFASGSILGIPWLVLIALIVVGGVSLMMRNYRIGRELYAMGSSPAAAELAGIQVARNLLGAFLLSGGPVRHRRRLGRHRLRAERGGRGGGRRRRRVRWQRLGLGRRPGRAAADRDRQRPGRPRHQPVLAAGHRRRPDRAGHRRRPDRRRAHRPEPAEARLACLT
jgi:ABC-type xylose transport system permease subunit